MTRCALVGVGTAYYAALLNFTQFFGTATTSKEIIQAWSKVRSGIAV